MGSPLSPQTYLLRNASKTLPLIGVIVLAIMLIMAIVSLMNSIPLSIRTIYDYSKEFVAVTPRGDPNRAPIIINKFKNDCPYEVDRYVICRGVAAEVTSIVGKWDFIVFGLSQEDMRYFVKKLGGEQIEGKWPEKGKPEVLVSEPVARNLKLKIGSVLLKPSDQDMYSPFEVKVVGIAKTSKWLMVQDIEYQRENHFPPVDNVLVYPRFEKDQKAIGEWSMQAFKGERSFVFTWEGLEKQTTAMFKILYGILDVVIFMLVVVITIMMGMLINIFQSQRLVEFGLLQALGYTKKQLLRRVLWETALVLIGGWITGVGLAIIILNIVKKAMFDPNAFALVPVDSTAVLYTVPVPLSIATVAFLTVVLRFRKFDPVSIVERRLV